MTYHIQILFLNLHQTLMPTKLARCPLGRVDAVTINLPAVIRCKPGTQGRVSAATEPEGDARNEMEGMDWRRCR